VRHTRRNPQKSPAELVHDPEKIAKSKKTSQKGAPGLGKPKKSYFSLHEEFLVENTQFEDLEPSAASEQTPVEINRAPYQSSSPLNLSPKKASHSVQNIPLSMPSIKLLPTIQSTSLLPHTPVMEGQQAPTKIERIVATRYGPLVLPIPLNPIHVGEYHKYMPKFTGTEGVTAKEHLEYFYSYADNLDISENDVWMRVFAQSLDGEARKWFIELAPRSIVDIEALDDAFLKHWGDKKDLLLLVSVFAAFLQ